MSLLSQTARSKLFSLITAQNPSVPIAIDESSLYLGRPHTDLDGKTILPCVAVLAGGYTGYVTFDYQRINLTTSFGDLKPEISAVGANTLHDMLPIVNKIFGLDLVPDDVIDVDVTATTPGSQIFIRVTASAVSLGYTGEFIFKYTRERPTLSVVIATVNLNALKHYKDPADGKMSLEMQMYDFDFTPYKSSLQLNYGTWRNLGAVQAIIGDYGFSTWPGAQIFTMGDYSTKDLSYANKKYDRVVVQPNVSIDGFVGLGLFHYNNVLA